MQPQSLLAGSQRPSPDLIPRRSLSDPIHSQLLPTTSDEFDTFKIYTGPDVSVILPRRTFERQELLRIITDTLCRGMQKKEQEHQKAVQKKEQEYQKTVQEMEDAFKAREKEIRREAYRKGRTSALEICNSPDFITMANLPPVKGVPGIPTYVIDTLERTSYKPDPSESDVWTVPPYDEISSFLTGLVRDRKSKKKLLGRYDGKPVFVITTGIVETHALDDGFFGKCDITWPDGKTMKAYCIGHFFCSGTALLLQEDDQLLAFTPEASLDEEWTGMNGSQGATLQIDSNGEASVSGVPHLVATSQAEW